MKKSLAILGAVALSASTFSCQTEADQKAYADSITEAELKEMLYTYASDEFEGRETGEPGQKKAVEFLKKHYEDMGIPSPIAPGDYFQEVPLQVVKTPKVSITVNDTPFGYYEDFMSYGSAATAMIEASEIVYAGFGIADDKHNDYDGLDVTGKIVVVKGGEPKDKAGNHVLTGSKEASKWSNGRAGIATKRDAAMEKGAKALFFMDDELFNRYAPFFQKRDEEGGHKRLSLVEKDADSNMHIFLMNGKMGAAMVPNIADSVTPETVEANIAIDYKSITEPMSSENVIAQIKGTEKPDEYIIISAHLDHVGMDKDGEVFNGADDDGSGTVAILEIAEAFKQAADAGHGPKRSIVFLHVTGEEKGLLGSRYYTDQDPILPLANTVANLNIDMIGRIDPKRNSDNRNYVYLIGSDKLSTELHNISEAMNTKYTNIELDYTYNDDNDPNRFYYRSDHYNFAKNNIPVIFYFNGTHDDYHQIGDTPDKIEYDLLTNRTKLVFHTAWDLANRPERIVVDKATEADEH